MKLPCSFLHAANLQPWNHHGRSPCKHPPNPPQQPYLKTKLTTLTTSPLPRTCITAPNFHHLITASLPSSAPAPPTASMQPRDTFTVTPQSSLPRTEHLHYFFPHHHQPLPLRNSLTVTFVVFFLTPLTVASQGKATTVAPLIGAVATTA